MAIDLELIILNSQLSKKIKQNLNTFDQFK